MILAAANEKGFFALPQMQAKDKNQSSTANRTDRFPTLVQQM